MFPTICFTYQVFSTCNTISLGTLRKHNLMLITLLQLIVHMLDNLMILVLSLLITKMPSFS
jgi:hypothetical protein